MTVSGTVTLLSFFGAFGLTYHTEPSARALAAVEQLAERFPANADISNAVGRLKFAQEIHSRIKERRGNHQVPRIPPRRAAGVYPPYRRSLPAKRP